MFPARTLVASPGYPGPTGGLAGGIGVLFPHGISFLEQQILVPGCAIAAIVQHGEKRFRMVSVYLPPARKEDTLSGIA
eukprot:9385678-Pyramimonas_sp.AAC.1